LKNRFLHLDYKIEEIQSANSKVPKCQSGTLDCSPDESLILNYIRENPYVKQKELVQMTGKSLRTVKRIMESLVTKNYICRVNGKRYGYWDILL
jgi:predicted HTH transcriptional regulator